ncbi:L-gulono-gamma-lactone oxidase [Capsaspora owczarzaki ATCC 30864]|uniref:L-gulono-gamma-lactone oxidase n=1 Tax=Capsaspora owczarzaki (strain ATCC 30864) TaxID=595528 RepID=A0A0D2VV19_CAPO3|nr:L-gulono-gamma-lactone oxidase [Capsaspora owczarzaki ATCC 30864]KJE95267.1 L-gulono-gamma-lactone oxidase [Capsaspora owczarzaki ATCC 30864]|eukprot:XP_004346410.1 L-gulono-gamma-lactone oxidase [Capsaspora owczarzaki ATCC 30864]
MEPLSALLPPWFSVLPPRLRTRFLPPSVFDTLAIDRLTNAVLMNNWARTFSCTPQRILFPESPEHVQSIVRAARAAQAHVKVVGRAHSPSDLACTSDTLVSLAKMRSVIHTDVDCATVTVEAGVVLADLHLHLAKHDLAISNLGAVSDVTIAGVISSGTHGSGANFGILSTMILELDIVVADGRLLTCSRSENAELFAAAQCGLGAFGIITRVKLQCERAFLLWERSTPTTLTEALERLPELITSSEHTKILWYPYTDHAVIIEADRARTLQKTKPPSAISSLWSHHLVQFAYWLSTFRPAWLVPLCNRLFVRLLLSNATSRVDDSYRIFNFDVLFQQYVSEWAIDWVDAPAALRRIRSAIHDNPDIHAHFPIEVRFVRRDAIPLSPCYGRDSCFIGIIMYRPYGKPVQTEPYWSEYERIMRDFAGRPHWAKAHKLEAEQFRQLYPCFDAMAQLRAQLDSSGIFLNDNLRRVFGLR